MTSILLTNDDGYNSIGFYPLLNELSKDFLVKAIAPKTEQSWVGKSISKFKELSIEKTKIEDFDIHLIDGTPADCVQIGIYDVFKKKPDIVVSGINIGNNLGHGFILSSGTVGAAMEASINGIKSLSFSLQFPPNGRDSLDFFNPKNYSIYFNAAKISAKIVKIFSTVNFSEGIDLISVNIPFKANINSGFEITKPYRNNYGKLFHNKNLKFKHINPPFDFKDLKKGTDLKALSDGKISITPINLDLVSKKSLEGLKNIMKNNW
ncbi:5'/3'-nucleotidase SurE [archaeon]|jgi:5'-nucleotidase|nr:5'/3'-nucleotidase SurE [archaeon]MBT4351103.1 5'/3'-nucleotidase SurE [archaeon]MBT4648089.1 5'/3'-nucleotidase SurE [archaeon]MBT6822527.1 5'/3'-nucleotidase SurE [archaeon]MBT7392528.1 5'/3'-nucleotidase SurE [archaeon]